MIRIVRRKLRVTGPKSSTFIHYYNRILFKKSKKNYDDMSEYQSSAVILPSAQKEISTRKKPWRALVAYWLLGLCNNYGYVVMLTAAGDIIGESEVIIVVIFFTYGVLQNF
jgi:hypothetical protein